MSVGAILTLGLGGFGNVNLLPTLGYTPGAAPIPAAVILYLDVLTGNILALLKLSP